MAISLDNLKGCELHVHTGGCFYAEDLLELGRDCYAKIDWTLYVRGYEKAFGVRPDPVALFEAALGGPDGFEELKRHYVYGEEDGGDFERFQAKFNFIVCMYRYWWRVLQCEEELMQRFLQRHRREGLDYIEYRSMYMHLQEDPGGFLNFHRLNARTIQDACCDGFSARYIISLPRWAPLEGYALVQRLFDEEPGLIPTIVGLDFCFVEEGYPPRLVRSLFERLERDNRERPERALEVVYHVGESYFDKSLESAIRWCHESAELGAARLGHAIALGLDPEAAIARRVEGHAQESVRERLEQLDYDLRHAAALLAGGVEVDEAALRREQEALQGRHPEEKVRRPYTNERLEEIRRRQDFVLERLAELGTVIECCPTSNLRIGGVPDAGLHPLHRFLRSRVNLVIGADDPGIFDRPLAAEIDWVRERAGMDPAALARRLGDPRRFRLGKLREQLNYRE